MSVLDKFVREVAELPNPNVTMVDMNLSENPKINKDILFQKILHNVEMSDNELTVLLKESYEDILSCIFEQDDLQYLQFVTTPRFVNSLMKVISTHSKDLKHTTKIHINKLVYDFITSHSVEPNDSVVYMNTLMVSLARMVNETHIRALIGIGLSNDMADFLALARFSSSKESTNIRRVNFIICTNLVKDYDMNNEADRLAAQQMVINIYSKLFNKLTILFESTMFDVYNLDDAWVTDSISEMYSITTLAVLDILNSMKMTDIRTLIMAYTQDYISVFAPKGYVPRISLRTLSGDYDRIRYVVEGLQTEENIYVP